ncbi:hypothetical protein [Streptomyces sp. NPDC051214]|uniref:hypothetical protein n=1 Tax=Streptomyces sp. NPDC051214 TaxID=3155282 RepID=UPI003418C780
MSRTNGSLRPQLLEAAMKGVHIGRRGRPLPETHRARRLRHLLTCLYTPLFLALAVLFGVWATRSLSGDPPSPWALAGLALLFAILALLALAVLTAPHHRHRDHDGPQH